MAIPFRECINIGMRSRPLSKNQSSGMKESSVVRLLRFGGLDHSRAVRPIRSPQSRLRSAPLGAGGGQPGEPRPPAWAGEPLTAEAVALLPVLGADVASARVATDATLHLVIGEAAIEVRPNDYYEAWQLHGPRNLRVVCSPGGDYVAVFEPDAQE
jgi:hypothetical protein